jgi:hypothetical protein
MKHLDSAVTTKQRAVNSTPKKHPNLPNYLSNLGTSLWSRFYWLGDEKDLEGAISNHQQAVSLTPARHPQLPFHHSRLSSSFALRYTHTKQENDLRLAIFNAQQAVELSPADHPEHAGYLNNLCVALFSLYEFGHNAEVLDAVITTAQRAVALTPPGHPDHPMYLTTLSLSFSSRFELAGAFNDVDSAIFNLQKAANSIPTVHPLLTVIQGALGNALSSRYQSSESQADFKSAVSTFRDVSEGSIGQASLRFQSALDWIALARGAGDLQAALEAYSVAIGLLPQLAWLGQSAESRQKIIATRMTRLAADAAACAIQLNELERAVELLEQGRAVFWTQATDLRRDLRDIGAKNADLAAGLQEVTGELERFAFRDASQSGTSLICSDAESTSQNHRRLAERWESLVRQVRWMASFENFLLPSTFSQLRHAAVGGSIVLINCSQYRCDAIIISSHEPTLLVPLPDISFNDLAELASGFRAQQLSNSREFEQRHLNPSLKRLWTVIVAPVLDAMGYLDLPTGGENFKPRIWWCPTGPLTFLPLHAAGPHTKGGGPDLCKRVISSYTSTIGALLRAKASTPLLNSICMLAVGQAETPGQAKLPGASVELDLIRRKMRPPAVNFTSKEGHEGTVKNVVEVLKDQNWVHFACHGNQHPSNPMESTLILHDGPLPLSTIASSRLPLADFAYLSACHSASGADTAPDEALHLAAGLQVAGFRSVIATMWAIGDDTGPKVADVIYEHLCNTGALDMASSEAAGGLNEAVQTLRRSKVQPSQWVPFINIGV